MTTKTKNSADELLKNLLLDEVKLAMEYVNRSVKSIESEMLMESMTFMKKVLENAKI